MLSCQSASCPAGRRVVAKWLARRTSAQPRPGAADRSTKRYVSAEAHQSQASILSLYLRKNQLFSAEERFRQHGAARWVKDQRRWPHQASFRWARPSAIGRVRRRARKVRSRFRTPLHAKRRRSGRQPRFSLGVRAPVPWAFRHNGGKRPTKRRADSPSLPRRPWRVSGRMDRKRALRLREARPIDRITGHQWFGPFAPGGGPLGAQRSRNSKRNAPAGPPDPLRSRAPPIRRRAGPYRRRTRHGSRADC